MKILLVEDNAKLNEAIQLYLEEQGFEVEIAFNGVQGLSKVKDLQKKGYEYDVIILDRMMPLKDGIETLREIKNLAVKSGIIILTAKDTVDDKVFGLAAGADDYMIKPFNVKELVARIHSLYRRNLLANETNKNISYRKDNNFSENENIKNVYDISSESSKIKNIDNLNFSFDINTGKIIFKENKNNKEILLTNKEASIFKFLLENNGRSMSKEDILEKIWRESEIPNSRFVDVHVHNLRSKLLKENFFGRIETIRNVGYKLILD